MSTNSNHKYNFYSKVAWIIYALAAIILATVLVLFVARDHEEMFFYGFMTIAAAYVLRPNKSIMDKQIFRFTDVSDPDKGE